MQVHKYYTALWLSVHIMCVYTYMQCMATVPFSVCLYVCDVSTMLPSSIQDGINALLHLLEWSWNTLLKQKSVSVFEAATSSGDAVLSKMKDPTMITFVTVACLDVLRAYITHVYPSSGTYVMCVILCIRVCVCLYVS